MDGMDDLPARLPVPGTPGQWIRILLAEAQTRGTLEWVAQSFTDEADSAGNPWAVEDEEPNIRGDLLKFLDEIDVRAELSWSQSEGSVLHAWPKSAP